MVILFVVVCFLSAVPNPVDTDYLVLSVIAAYLNCCWAQVLADCPSKSPLGLELAALGVPDPKVGCRPEASVAFMLRDRTAPFIPLIWYRRRAGMVLASRPNISVKGEAPVDACFAVRFDLPARPARRFVDDMGWCGSF
ncbi:hypothetical protein T08_6460 [Trichinella sp. T8]|nr:hypothetical protein T08_6460 [Trichinella sp. T8]